MTRLVSVWFALGLVPVPLMPAVPAGHPLERAAATESRELASKRATYRGTQVNLEEGRTRRFVMVAQGSDDFLYALFESEQVGASVWSYSRGRAWSQPPGKAASELTGDSLQSWRLLAVLLSPNRYSYLSSRASWSEPDTPAAGPFAALTATLEGGLTFTANVRPADGVLVSIDRLSGRTKRTTAFVNPRVEDGVMKFDGLQSLRDGVPYRLFRMESVNYAAVWDESSFTPDGFARLADALADRRR